ncbi:MAG: hypothetical protein M0031_09525 [Thermaerobacter sp.]|nr:hypothetical protein [Thermaerobacter sp.]
MATAFLAEVRGRRVVIGPYHAWGTLGIIPGQAGTAAYLTGYRPGGPPPGVRLPGKGRWASAWGSDALVLDFSRSSDVAVMAAPPELRGVIPLRLAHDPPAASEQAGGLGFAYGMWSAAPFGGEFAGENAAVREAAPASGALPAFGDTLAGAYIFDTRPGEAAVAGDSGAPVAATDGRVLGEEVAAVPGYFVAVPAYALREAILRDAPGMPSKEGGLRRALRAAFAPNRTQHLLKMRKLSLSKDDQLAFQRPVCYKITRGGRDVFSTSPAALLPKQGGAVPGLGSGWASLP